MKRVDDYITNYEANKFCANCNEVCSRHCAIMRKAYERYDQDHKEDYDDRRSTAEGTEKV